MSYRFHPAAEEELLTSIEYYESLNPGLGEAFALEIETSLENIASFPDAWPMLKHPVRRCLISRFPFGILYIADQNQIYVLAIMNLHRDPTYWKNRL